MEKSYMDSEIVDNISPLETPMLRKTHASANGLFYTIAGEECDNNCQFNRHFGVQRP